MRSGNYRPIPDQVNGVRILVSEAESWSAAFRGIVPVLDLSLALRSGMTANPLPVATAGPQRGRFVASRLCKMKFNL